MSRHVPYPAVPPLVLAEAAAKREPGLEQKMDEPDESYKGFLQYCILGPGARAQDVANAAGLSRTTMSTYKFRHHWIARIEEWWRLKQMNSNLQPDCENDGWRERRDQLRKEEWEMHSELLATARDALARWKNSDRIPTLGDIARVLELASRLGRLAAGLPMNHTEVSGNPEMPIRVEIEAALERAYGSEVVDTVVVDPAPILPATVL